MIELGVHVAIVDTKLGIQAMEREKYTESWGERESLAMVLADQTRKWCGPCLGGRF